jgi:hypothetical protein
MTGSCKSFSRSFVWILGILTYVLLVTGCGGSSGSVNNSSSTITSVTASCTPTTVITGQTSQCSATVQGTGAFSSSVAWAVNGIANGNSTVGIISSAGLYTAPATVPNPATVTVMATSVQDGSESGSIQIAVVVPGLMCSVTSDTIAPAVDAGGTHTFTAACPTPEWTVSGPGSINPSTGVYTAPERVWAQDVSRGVQLLPNDSVYKLPINHLPVDSRSSYWIQRVVDNGPSFPSYHTFKLGLPGLLNFYDNVVTNSTAKQKMHFFYAGDSNPWQDTLFPVPLPPNVNMQNGWSQDVAAGLDRHIFSINIQTGDDAEMYQFVIDYQTISITSGNPTRIAYTTNSIRTLQNPIRVYISGITGGCSILNGSYNATVITQAPGTGGTLSVAVNTTGMNCASGAPVMSGGISNCNRCNSAGGQHWFPYSNAITGGTDAGGSPISATSVHTQEWWNVVQQNILDPACNCVTLGHALRTTLSNQYISPRNLWPAVQGTGVTGGHPNMILLSATTGATTTFTISGNNCNNNTQSFLQCQLPCPRFTYSTGCQFHIMIGNQNPYTSTWGAANGNWVATAVSNTSFSIPLNSTGFPALPENGTFIFDWLPYGAHIRLKSSFDVDNFCSNNSLDDKCPYEKAILNTLKVYGLVVLDGTVPGDNWDSGIVSSEFNPDQLTGVAVDFGSNDNFQNIEQYLEVADASGQQLKTNLPYTNPNNQIGLTANNRVTVSASSSGYAVASIDVQLRGTAVGTDRERISMVTGTTYQINSWVTGNVNTAASYSMSPSVPGANVSASGLLTAPSSLSGVTKTTVTITSVADNGANAYIDVYFIPVSADGSIRLNFGQQATSYTDHLGNVWWGQVVSRPFNSTYEIGDGIGFAYLNGTWSAHSSNWSGTTDAQLYAQSTSAENDTNLTIVVLNGTYKLTLYGEPGYGIVGAGQNVYDVEINGMVISSYNDGYLLPGGVYKGYTLQYHVTIPNGILQFNGRIREHDSGGHGMSLSSLLISPGGQ